MEVWLDIQAPAGDERVPVRNGRLTIGDGEEAGLRIVDAGLARLHASIHRDGERVWILNEASSEGLTVNGRAVPTMGLPLRPGDVVALSAAVRLLVSFSGQAAAQQAALALAPAEGTSPEIGLSRTTIAIAVLLIVGLLSGLGVLGAHIINARQERARNEAEQRLTTSETARRTDPQNLTPTPPETANSTSASPANSSKLRAPLVAANSQDAVTLYGKMDGAQRYKFLDRCAPQIARMMGNRGTAFDQEVLGYIKHYVDSYDQRVGNRSKTLWGEDLHFLFARATEMAPHIIASFRKERVPVVIGLYIPVIESEYHKCLPSPAGALGMFQFIAPTAKAYGIDPVDRCNAVKMAPAAALYMKDRIREFGTDAMSVALGIAGYNRSPKSVRRDLQDVIDSKNNERSFWTLLARQEELDHFFQRENIKYVPKFFAAAIVGENPQAFGLRIRKLSTYDQP